MKDFKSQKQGLGIFGLLPPKENKGNTSYKHPYLSLQPTTFGVELWLLQLHFAEM